MFSLNHSYKQEGLRKREREKEREREREREREERGDELVSI